MAVVEVYALMEVCSRSPCLSGEALAWVRLHPLKLRDL